MKKQLLRIMGIVLFFTVSCLLWYYFDLRSLLTLSSIQQHEQLLRTYITTHYPKAVLIFIAGYALHGSFSLPATSLLMVCGGFLFGTCLGAFYSLLGSLIGGTSSYLTTKLLLSGSLHKRYAKELITFKTELRHHYISYLLLLRIIPIIPFCVGNILCGLTAVPFGTFIWTLVVGVLPSCIIYSALGSELGTVTAIHQLVTWKILLIFLVLILLSAAPLLKRPAKKPAPPHNATSTSE